MARTGAIAGQPSHPAPCPFADCHLLPDISIGGLGGADGEGYEDLRR